MRVLGLFLWFSLPLHASDCATDLLATLNRQYLRLHEAKESALWQNHMGTLTDSQEFTRAEAALRKWAAHPRLRESVVKALEDSSLPSRVAEGLTQWLSFFEVNSRPDWHPIIRKLASKLGRPTTDQLFKNLAATEEALASAKRSTPRFYQSPGQAPVSATVMQLRNLVLNHKEEATRKAALDALHGFELDVVAHLVPIIKNRRRVAQRLGYPDYYEWRLQSTEKISTSQLFSLYDDFVSRTDAMMSATIEGYRREYGDSGIEPWNLDYLTTGANTERIEPYLPFDQALHLFGKTFAGMGVDFRGGSLKVDLLDRPGKSPNGFIRAPRPAYFELGFGFQPVVAQFASNASPGAPGSGYDALGTVLHEGGHYAHYSNIATSSVAASQEEAPSSFATAETQSMFFEALLADPMWLGAYARSENGEAVPWEIVRDYLSDIHQKRVRNLRWLLMVPYFERALYQLPDEKLTAENILSLARQTEKRLLGTHSPRPLLTYEHPHSLENAACYHGYSLAEFAVYITRAHFLDKDGSIVGNPNVGPALAKHYWAPGNSVSFMKLIQSLTGKTFSMDPVLEIAAQPREEFLAQQKLLYERGVALGPMGETSRLNSDFTVIDGENTLSSTLNGKSFDQVADDFARWIRSIERE